MTLSVYLAGPEVFLANADEQKKRKLKLCQLFGVQGIWPWDDQLQDWLDKPQMGLFIAYQNCKLIEQCDAIIANITPFRGASLDVGTAFEIGYGRALGKTVLAYTNVVEDFLHRNLTDTQYANVGSAHTLKDKQGMSYEDFGLEDNLMISAAVNGTIVKYAASEAERYTDLTGFEQCLVQLSRMRQHLNVS